MDSTGMPESQEQGFTLVELMVVVLVAAILLAIAVPTFLGARQRAGDRAAQSNVRNAHVTQLILYADRQQFTQDPAELTRVDSSLAYSPGLSDLDPTGKVVYVQMLPDTVHPSDTVLVGAKSSSGSCFWIRTIGGSSLPRFADNDCRTAPAPSEFRNQW